MLGMDWEAFEESQLQNGAKKFSCWPLVEAKKSTCSFVYSVSSELLFFAQFCIFGCVFMKDRKKL